MTLVIGFSTMTDCFLASDRMVSLAHRSGRFAGQHDSASNKSVIYIADDGVIALAYTGSAYIHGIPTDKFIAECLYDEGIPSGVFFGNRSRQLGGTVADRLHALRQLCAHDWTGGYVEILAVGFRDHRRVLRPFSVVFQLGQPFSGGIDFRLSLSPARSYAMRSVGATVTSTEAAAALAQSTLSLHPGDPEHIADFLSIIIKKKASVDRTVGNDVMLIRIRGRERQVDSQFLSDLDYNDPSEVVLEGLSVAFTPWLIGWQTFIAPSHIAGPQPLCLSSGEWTGRLFGPPTDARKGLLLSAQPRKPMP